MAAELPLLDSSIDPCSFRVRGAAVGRLDIPFGPRWLAAGDAVMTQDPLSSRGVVAALLSGLHSALALAACRDGVPGSRQRYADTLRAIFDQHLIARRAWYGAEPRWSESPFWRRRQGGRYEETAPRRGRAAARTLAATREEQP